MNKKRFILIDGVKKGTHSGIWDNLKQNNQRVGDELWVGEVVAMLNEGVAIVDENKQLKKDATVLIYSNQDYRKENEQLKTDIQDIQTGTYVNARNTIKELKQENEQLKNHIKTLQNNTKRLENQNIQTYNFIKEAYRNERTALGRSVLKQLLEQME